jgi:hypothetical protein
LEGEKLSGGERGMICDFFMWLCEKTGHLVRKEWEEKSNGVYDACEICGRLIWSKEKNDGNEERKT